jgi:hypothetical protein
MMQTLREKYYNALTMEGYQPVESKSSKYVVFKRTEGSYWYIGKSGSLRVGSTITTSVPVSGKCKQFLLDKVERNV